MKLLVIFLFLFESCITIHDEPNIMVYEYTIWQSDTIPIRHEGLDSINAINK